MAQGVYFGSPREYLLQPGAYTLVDASQLNIAGSIPFNTVCVMGSGLGGEPMRPYQFNDPLQAQRLFGARSPLAEMIRMAFKGGANGGAPTVIGIRVDDAGRAFGSLSDANSGTQLKATHDDYGAYGNTWALSFFPGTVTGTMAVIRGTGLNGNQFEQTIDNQPSFSQLINRINNESPLTVEVLAGGVRASQTLTIATSQEDGRSTVTDSQGVIRTSDGYAYQYPAETRENITNSMVVAFNSPISWALSAVDDAGDTITTDAVNDLVAGAIIRLEGDTLPGGVNAADTYVVRTTPTNSSFTLGRVVPEVSYQIGSMIDASNLMTAPGHGLSNGDVVRFEGISIPTGLAFGRNYFVVGVNGDNFQVSAESGGVAVDISGSISSARVIRLSDNVTVDVSGAPVNATVIALPGYAEVSGSNPVEFDGIRKGYNGYGQYAQALVGAIITESAYSSDSARWTLDTEVWGNFDGLGLPGTVFTIASGNAYAGTYQILEHEFDGFEGDKKRVIRKLSGDRQIQPGTFTGSLDWYAQYQFPKTTQPPDEGLSSLLPANGLLARGGQYLSVVVGDRSILYNTLQGDTIEDVGEALANLINQNDELQTVATAAYNADTYTSTLTLLAKTAGTTANTLPVNINVNVQATVLVSRAGATLDGGVEPKPPRAQTGETNGTILLANGFDSAPTYRRWLDALDAVRFLRVRYIIPATADIGVQLACSDHVELMSSTGKRRERMAVLGHGKGWTHRQIRERAEIFQNYRVVFCNPHRPEGRLLMADPVSGTLRHYEPFYAAGMVAGAIAAEGQGVADPVTRTYLNNLVLEKAHQPGSIELDELIESGVLTFEYDDAATRQSQGFRITRGVTTWRVSGNSSYGTNSFQWINIVGQSDFAAAFIREQQEALLIGRPAFITTIPEMVQVTNTAAQRLVDNKMLFGFDPAFTTISQNGELATAFDCAYKIYPAPGIEFILNLQVLSAPPESQTTFSAAA